MLEALERKGSIGKIYSRCVWIIKGPSQKWNKSTMVVLSLGRTASSIFLSPYPFGVVVNVFYMSFGMVVNVFYVSFGKDIVLWDTIIHRLKIRRAKRRKKNKNKQTNKNLELKVIRSESKYQRINVERNRGRETLGEDFEVRTHSDIWTVVDRNNSTSRNRMEKVEKHFWYFVLQED